MGEPQTQTDASAAGLTLSLVVQMAGLHQPGQPERHYTGSLDEAAQSWCEYMVSQLQRLNEPRGGDLICIVSLQRGDETGGYQYREGRYLQAVTSDGR